jgi:hypothetical protein
MYPTDFLVFAIAVEGAEDRRPQTGAFFGIEDNNDSGAIGDLLFNEAVWYLDGIESTSQNLAPIVEKVQDYPEWNNETHWAYLFDWHELPLQHNFTEIKMVFRGNLIIRWVLDTTAAQPTPAQCVTFN